MVEINFRTDDKEREEIRARNKARTEYILEAAGVTEDNHDYKRWYRATILNVHNAYRFSYNGETEADLEAVFESFIRAIKENSVEQYEEATKEFVRQRAKIQLEKSSGAFANKSTYDEMRQILDNTVKSGIDMRQERRTVFPKEFYAKDGSLRRIVMDIPLEMQEESAMTNIDEIVAKYRNIGIGFSAEDNKFIVKGQKVGPEKFFTAKMALLSGVIKKYEKDQAVVDMKDDELFKVLEESNYEGFMALNKKRGMEGDKRNGALRNALKDEVIFHEICDREIRQTNLVHRVEMLYDKFARAAQIVSKESEKDVLGRVDRVMFSVIPWDLATQSTLRNWQSCMHTSGCNHSYVADSIGCGSIVAYGYDSQNPQKMVSRLLIHPYYDEKGNMAYKVNERIYGRDNTGFRNAVQKVTAHFNEGKYGQFELADGLYEDNENNNLILLRKDDKGRCILDDWAKDGTVIINKDLVSAIQFGDKVVASDKVVVEFCSIGCTIADEVDLSGIENLRLGGYVIFGKGVKLPSQMSYSDGLIIKGHIPDGMDLSMVEKLKLRDIKSIGKEVKLPKDVTVRRNIMDGVDLSGIENLTIDGEIEFIGKGVSFPKNVTVRGKIPDGADLSGVENLRLGGYVIFGKGVKLPSQMSYSDDLIIKGYIPDGMDLSMVEKLKLMDIKSIGKEVKLPKDVTVEGDIPEGTDLSGVENLRFAKSVTFGEKVKLPNQISYSKDLRISGYIPDGVDLRGVEKVTLSDIESISKEVKFPKNVTVFGNISDGVDLSGVEKLRLSNIESIGKEVKFPENVTVSGDIPDRMDLSGVGNLRLENIEAMGKEIKLPKNVTFEGRIPEGMDLSGVENLRFAKSVTFDKEVKLPNQISYSKDLRISGHVPDGMDLRGVENLTLFYIKAVGKEVKLPKKVTVYGKLPDGENLSGVENLKLFKAVQIAGR